MYGTVTADVEGRRKSLHLDDVQEYVSPVDQFKGRPLHFRKLRYGQVVQVLGMMPNLSFPPDEATDQEWQEFWNQVSPEDKMRQHEAMSTALAVATTDGYSLQDMRDLEPTLVGDIFAWLMDFTGFSDKAVEDLTWFRRHGGRPDGR